jgi:hypothetical protein
MFITYYYEAQIERDVKGGVRNTHLGDIKVPMKSSLRIQEAR